MNASIKSPFSSPYFSFNKLATSINNNKENENMNMLLKFINSLVLFIVYNIHNICIEHVNSLFYKIINIHPIYIEYLKGKNLEKWVNSFFDDDDDAEEEEELILNEILSEEHFPKMTTEHKILVQKSLIFEGTKIELDEKEVEIMDIKRLKDTSSNMKLIQMLYGEFIRHKI